MICSPVSTAPLLLISSNNSQPWFHWPAEAQLLSPTATHSTVRALRLMASLRASASADCSSCVAAVRRVCCMTAENDGNANAASTATMLTTTNASTRVYPRIFAGIQLSFFTIFRNYCNKIQQREPYTKSWQFARRQKATPPSWPVAGPAPADPVKTHTRPAFPISPAHTAPPAAGQAEASLPIRGSMMST